MTTGPAPWDTTVRVVIWCDAALSALVALLGVAGPVVALSAGSPRPEVTPATSAVVGAAVLAAALVLAALGTVTAVLLALRVRAGHLAVPAGLRVPWPGAGILTARRQEPAVDGSAGCGVRMSP